jgi:hypothetical protein
MVYIQHISTKDQMSWRLCFYEVNSFTFCCSYCKVNGVTLPFEYPLPRCEDAIEDFGDSADKLLVISLDARSGYHQIAVRE